jgi:hypothetical protein
VHAKYIKRTHNGAISVPMCVSMLQCVQDFHITVLKTS